MRRSIEEEEEEHTCGERRGEEGAGEEEETPESPAMEVARWGRRPYLRTTVRICLGTRNICFVESKIFVLYLGLGATGLPSWRELGRSSREELEEEW